MTTIVNPYSWESASLYHRIKQSFSLEISPAASLIRELDEFKMSAPKWSTLHKVVAYLAVHSNSKLQAALENRFKEASLSEVKASLNSIAAYSLSTGRLKMLDVCQKIAGLHQLKSLAQVNDAIQLAQADALVAPNPKRSFAAISDSLRQRWCQNAGIFTKVMQYFIQTIAWSYSIDLDRPPNSYWMAQNQWTFFRTFVDDVLRIETMFLNFFSTAWKAALAGLGLLASLAGLKFLYNYFNLGSPESLDRNQFRNLIAEARAGRLQQTEGRAHQLEMLESCLSTPPGQKPRIPLLIGLPGVGKTQVVEGLAMKIAKGEIPALKEKKLFAVNTADLLEFGQFSEQGYSSRLDTLLKQIEGYEKDIILFFDEAQNGAAKTEAPGNAAPPLLELLKTKLLEKKILCILATTKEEYQKHIAPNKPFAERTKKIDFPPLDKETTRIILQKRARFGGDNVVKIDFSAINAILKVADTHPDYRNRANPRKSEHILQEAIGYVYSWKPKKLAAEIEKLEIEQKKWTAQCLQHRKACGWALTSQGKNELAELQTLNIRLKALKDRKSAVDELFAKVSRLRGLEPVYSEREYEMIHLLAERGKNEKAEKAYLFLQFIVLPSLRSQIEQQAAMLKRDFDETIPLEVDAGIIHRLYP
jgi:ATP-dependent Clp protease ATP-binding subunit ClpA